MHTHSFSIAHPPHTSTEVDFCALPDCKLATFAPPRSSSLILKPSAWYCSSLVRVSLASLTSTQQPLLRNIGGQSSPISSPQNLIALQHMDPPLDWARWFAVALPVSTLSIVLIWWLLLVSYNPARSPDPTEPDIKVKPIRATKEPFTLKQYWVTFVCLVTIGLWCVEHQIEASIGDMGIIAIIPIVAFFSTGVLKKVLATCRPLLELMINVQCRMTSNTSYGL